MKRRWILIAILGVLFCTALVFSFRVGMRFAAPGALEQPGESISLPVRTQEREKVSLYFSDAEEKYLVAEIREILLPKEAPARARKILETLLDGPGNHLVSVIPRGTELFAFYLDGDVAVADFSPELRDNHPQSSYTEMLTLSSIANTLILNVPEIQGVKILVDGQEADSLAGHVMLRNPLTANMTIVR